MRDPGVDVGDMRGLKIGLKNRATETKEPRQSRRGSLAVSKTLASRYVGGKWLGVYRRVSEAYSRAGGVGTARRRQDASDCYRPEVVVNLGSQMQSGWHRRGSAHPRLRTRPRGERGQSGVSLMIRAVFVTFKRLKINSILSNPAAVLKSDSELSRNLVGGCLRATFQTRSTARRAINLNAANDDKTDRIRSSYGHRGGDN